VNSSKCSRLKELAFYVVRYVFVHNIDLNYVLSSFNNIFKVYIAFIFITLVVFDMFMFI